MSDYAPELILTNGRSRDPLVHVNDKPSRINALRRRTCGIPDQNPSVRVEFHLRPVLMEPRACSFYGGRISGEIDVRRSSDFAIERRCLQPAIEPDDIRQASVTPRRRFRSRSNSARMLDVRREPTG